MKTVISAKSFFKKVSEKAAVRAGEKRPDLEWSFQGFSVASPESLAEFQAFASQEAEKISFVLNAFIEAFGRKQIADKSDDWNFVPSPESLTFEAAYLDATTQTSRSRLITKESLSKLGEFYFSQASKLGVSQASALAGKNVISSRFQLIAGKDDAIKVMQSRLLQLVEVCEPSDVEPFADLIEALITETTESLSLQITADAL